MFNTFPINEEMHIHSLNGELRKATILKRLGDNDYLAEYNGVKCHAIYNPFVNKFYVDDKYSVIRDKMPSRDEPCR
ncbi:hypothetical protein A7K50_01180 [Dehalobacter sp. MCB1]|uniref:hypothetical protein n=1 Tax=unclassified Dehalobacter TaxID=2635733 RepID=UPI000E6CF66A|nr:MULTISPECIES: hypothetical protein [unclassified Dehalobacter]RJE47888.1 hypothetical protein A7K50_01180 [Dehalobacter sp. MCB1]TCX56065.1 hypothetical protein C1I38_00660 [Dehalobacter sp. 12DCB1]